MGVHVSATWRIILNGGDVAMFQITLTAAFSPWLAAVLVCNRRSQRGENGGVEHSVQVCCYVVLLLIAPFGLRSCSAPRFVC